MLKLTLISFGRCVNIECNPKTCGVSYKQIMPSAILPQPVDGIDTALRRLGFHVGIVSNLTFDFHNYVVLSVSTMKSGI